MSSFESVDNNLMSTWSFEMYLLFKSIKNQMIPFSFSKYWSGKHVCLHKQDPDPLFIKETKYFALKSL